MQRILTKKRRSPRQKAEFPEGLGTKSPPASLIARCDALWHHRLAPALLETIFSPSNVLAIYEMGPSTQ